MRLPIAVVFAALLACKRGAPSAPAGPSAGDVCHKLEAAGVAAKCQTASRGDLGAIARKASEYVTFDLPSAPGKAGKVLLFRNAADHAEAIQGFEAASFLVGPHRYGSSKALIYVELNKAATADAGTKAAAVVAGL